MKWLALAATIKVQLEEVIGNIVYPSTLQLDFLKPLDSLDLMNPSQTR